MMCFALRAWFVLKTGWKALGLTFCDSIEHFFYLCLSSHYFDPRKKDDMHTKKKSGNKQQLTLMNQWPFSHTKHTRNREILGANENGQIQKNRKTEEIPIGHSSARKQRAQNFSARKKNQKSETEKFYIIILLPDGCAVELCEFYNLATIRQNMLLLLSRSGSSSTYEEFYKYRKEMEEKIWEKLNMFFLVLFLWIVWAAQIKGKALLRTKKKKVL